MGDLGDYVEPSFIAPSDGYYGEAAKTSISHTAGPQGEEVLSGALNPNPPAYGGYGHDAAAANHYQQGEPTVWD